MGENDDHKLMLKRLQEVRDDLGLQRNATREVRKAISELRRILMAMSTAQQGAINDLSSGIESLATTLGGVTTAAQGYRDQIAAFVAQDTVDAADKAALQAIIQGMDSDVVGALTPLTVKVNEMDAGLKSPATPDSPLHAEP